MADPNIGERVASVYERVYPSKPQDNVFDSHAFFHAMGSEGFKSSQPGGRLFELPIEYGVNTTQQMVSEFSTLDTSRIQVFDAARFDIKIAAGTCVYSYLEQSMVRGDEAKFDLIAARVENARKSHFNLINTQAWSTLPPGPEDLTSIPTIISTTPTTTVVGGINPQVFTWWRNRANSGQMSTQAGDNLIRAMELTADQCSLGGFEMTPTFIISDLASYVLYQNVLQTRLRYFVEDLGKKGDASFLASAIRFKNTAFVYDEQAPANSVYFLNNKVLFCEYLEGAFAKLDPAVDPANMLTNVHKLYSFLNLTTNGRRHLGVVFNVS